MEIHFAGEVMGYFDIDLEVQLAENAPKEKLAPFISNMMSDEGADLLSELSKPLQNSLIPLLAKAKREQLLKLSSYENGTCGSLMNADYVSVPTGITAKAAIKQIQVEASKKEIIYYIYVVDSQHRLLGVASIKDLMLAQPMKIIDDLMFRDAFAVNGGDDQEKAIEIIENHTPKSLPDGAEEEIAAIILDYEFATAKTNV